MDKAPLYAQFDGEEIAGKRYGLGDKIDSDVHPAVLQILEQQGRISGTEPSIAATPTEAKPVEDMSRAELEAGALDAMKAQIADASDERLRDAISMHRSPAYRGDDGTDDGDDAGDADQGDANGEKPLSQQTTAELTATAEREGVDLSGATTNAKRVEAIEAARAAKANS